MGAKSINQSLATPTPSSEEQSLFALHPWPFVSYGNVGSQSVSQGDGRTSKAPNLRMKPTTHKFPAQGTSDGPRRPPCSDRGTTTTTTTFSSSSSSSSNGGGGGDSCSSVVENSFPWNGRSRILDPSRWTTTTSLLLRLLLLLCIGCSVALLTCGSGEPPIMAHAFEAVRPLVVQVRTTAPPRTGTKAATSHGAASRGRCRRFSLAIDVLPNNNNDGARDGDGEDEDEDEDSPSSRLFPEDRAVIAQWRVSQLKSELDQRGADYRDCFDKESLVERFMQAQRTNFQDERPPSDQNEDEEEEAVEAAPSGSPTTQPQQHQPPPPTDESTAASVADLLKAVQAMSVKELKTELAARNIRWGGLLEKKDLVQALVNARQSAALFSSTGLVSPKQVTDLTADQIEQEVQWQSSSTTTTTTSSLLLVDVYATWCGPCQLMASILKEAASDLPHVRFAKLDSDRYPELSGRWRVQGLPTLLLFDGGREVARWEGALPKDQLLSWVREHSSAAAP